MFYEDISDCIVREMLLFALSVTLAWHFSEQPCGDSILMPQSQPTADPRDSCPRSILAKIRTEQHGTHNSLLRPHTNFHLVGPLPI